MGRILDLFINKYNYTDFHELNLDWIISDLRTLTETLENFISLNTIKYANPIQWNITKQYEANTVVIDPNDGTAYLSVNPVPVGVALTNTDYWTPIFTLNLLSANQNITLRDDGSNVLATFASNTDDWLIWNSILYKVSQSIAINEAYVPGYNLDRYSVELFIKDYIDALNNKIGDLSNLNTTDKSNLVAAINEVIVSTVHNTITFEQFGAVGDGVTDDTQAINDAIAYGNSNNKIVSSEMKTYLISDDITIPAGTHLYRTGLIKAATTKTITINFKSSWTYGNFDNVKIDSDSYLVALNHITIKNISSGHCLEVSQKNSVSSAEFNDTKCMTLYNDILIYNNSDSTATGVYCTSPDMHFTNVEVINCLVGYRIPANCKLINCNVWVNNVISNFGSTIGYQIVGQNARLCNCTADTVALAISLPSAYYTVILNGFELIFNTTIKQNTTFNFVNYYGDFLGNVTVDLSGMAAASNTFNINYQSRLDVSFVNGSAADYNNVIYSLTASNNGTVSQVNCKRYGGLMRYKFRVSFPSGDAPVSASPTITIAKNFADIAGVANSGLREFICPAIYNTSSGQVVGFASCYVTTANTIVINSYYAPSGAASFNNVMVDMSIPVSIGSL